MSYYPDQLPDWPPGQQGYAPPAGQQTAGSDGSTETTVPGAGGGQRGQSAWPWDLPAAAGGYDSAAGLDQPANGDASGGAPLYSSGQQQHSTTQGQPFTFDFGDSASYWGFPNSAGHDPVPSSSSFGSGGATGDSGGVSLSMLDLASRNTPGSTLPHGDVNVASNVRRDSLDSGIPSSATQPRKHSRADSDGDGTPEGRERSGGSGEGSGGSSRKSSAFDIGEGRPGGNGRTDSGESGTAAVSSAVPKKIVQRADKSCKKCRERRVRCDRLWPTCERCKKRRETCEWADATRVEEIEEGGDAERIADLTAKVAQLERQLKNTSTSSSSAAPSSASHPFTAPLTSGPPTASSSHAAPPFPVASSLAGGTTTTQTDNSGASIASAIRFVWDQKIRLTSHEDATLKAFLTHHSVANAEVGRGSVTWRLGEEGMAVALTRHLLDAALHACCSKLPGIKPLSDRVEYYKSNLHILPPSEQCHVAVLAALGARASPHSQLLGISTIALQDGTPSPPLYLYAGERREMACRHLEARARELCWQHGLILESDMAHLDSLVGLVQLLIYEEILPSQSRFFVRNAVGMYMDIRQEAIDKGERTSREPNAGPGTALFLADAVIAAACSRPSYITTGELDLFFVSDGVPVPDFPGSDLRDELGKILQRPLSRSKLSDALATSSLWVCGCARLFAQLTTARRPGASSSLPLLKNLWTLIDKVHNGVQELQQLLVSLTVDQVTNCEGDPYALEHFVLLGVRFDAILVDVVNLMHGWLMRNRNGPGQWSEAEDDELLGRMRQESELRVRKCLKLSSFYAQLYLQSQDKHLVHHMLMQLEMLPDWTNMAAERIGEPGGPISDEYELTENELDWLQQALELSSYYTPKAAHRLQKMAEARKKHSPEKGIIPSLFSLLKGAPKPDGPLPTVDSLNARQAAYESHQPSNEHYHYDLPPHNTASIRALNPPNDPSMLFDVSGGFVPHPSQLYVFDSYGIAAHQGIPLSTAPAVPSLSFVQTGFHNPAQTWLHEVAPEAESPAETQGVGEYMPPPQEEVLVPQGGKVEVGEVGVGPGEGAEWMRAAGRGETGRQR
ncbi:hypothetical protein JCM6882_007284 [Rhodosporidiobolus microsporus]